MSLPPHTNGRQEDSACAALAHNRDRVAQAGAITSAWRGNGGPVSPLLAKGR